MYNIIRIYTYIIFIYMENKEGQQNGPFKYSNLFFGIKMKNCTSLFERQRNKAFRQEQVSVDFLIICHGPKRISPVYIIGMKDYGVLYNMDIAIMPSHKQQTLL